jgi:prepilin peptidase CpaA
VAAVIDGWALKVPNWLTYPLILSGWVYSTWAFGWEGLGWSMVGTLIGLALLLPAYAVGGMGAGDVKLLAGVGAWIHMSHTLYAFGISAVVGALLAILMVLYRRSWKHHFAQFRVILSELLTIRDPQKLSEIAAERKPSMLLLPYGIPIAIGTIAYFAFTGMLV